jgi:hypothetical protein
MQMNLILDLQVKRVREKIIILAAYKFNKLVREKSKSRNSSGCLL